VILGRVLTFSVERYPEAQAVLDGDHRYTYAEWNRRINRLANGLASLGVNKGYRVVILLKNREEMAAVHWALQKLGAIPTPVNWRYGPSDIEYVAKDAEARAVIFEGASLSAVEGTRERLGDITYVFVGKDAPTDCHDFEGVIDGSPDDEPSVEVAESDTSIMLYTSGTTGRPKGVPRTHKNEHSAALAHIIQSRNALFDRTLGVMPFYHTMGVRSLLAMAITNGFLVVQNDWDPRQALRLIEDERVNSLYLVPTLYHDLVNTPEFNSTDLSRLTKLGYAGAPMSSALTERLIEAVKPEVFVNHLGSTEVYTFTVCDRVANKPTCAGRAGINSRTRIVKADPQASVSPNDTLAQGKTGELIVSLGSDEAFSAYWNRPDADAKAIRSGWYFTGDLAYEDKEGDIYVVGRVDDMIISGGENIYPIEVEDVLYRHDQIAEVAVIGTPDERLGQRVTAYVVPKEPAPTPKELDEFCKRSPDLANFKRPRAYYFLEVLPKSPTGKLLRRKLTERAPETSGIGHPSAASHNSEVKR
jgi:2-furoate---CoA ligase